jgi:hypothetical protein
MFQYAFRGQVNKDVAESKAGADVVVIIIDMTSAGVWHPLTMYLDVVLLNGMGEDGKGGKSLLLPTSPACRVLAQWISTSFSKILWHRNRTAE